MYLLTVSYSFPTKAYAKLLQEQSTKDAAAVKILTIITLIYLPTTIVSVSPWNFF